MWNVMNRPDNPDEVSFLLAFAIVLCLLSVMLKIGPNVMRIASAHSTVPCAPK